MSCSKWFYSNCIHISGVVLCFVCVDSFSVWLVPLGIHYPNLNTFVLFALVVFLCMIDCHLSCNPNLHSCCIIRSRCYQSLKKCTLKPNHSLWLSKFKFEIASWFLWGNFYTLVTHFGISVHFLVQLHKWYILEYKIIKFK